MKRLATTLLSLAGLAALSGAGRSAAAAAESPAQVPLEIFASSVSVEAYPVEVGLPLPRGTLKDASHLRLLDAGGRPVALQAEPLSRYPDGSLRSVLLVFLAPLKKGAASTYAVEFGDGVKNEKAPARLTCRPAGGGVEVETGAVGFRIARGGRRLLEGVTVEGKPVSHGISLFVLEKGQEKPSFEIENAEVALEESGPVRAVVRVRGRFSRSPATPAYEVRIHAHAGSSLLRLQHVIAGTSEKDGVRWAGWGLRVDGPAAKASAGVDGKVVDLPAGEKHGLVQDGEIALLSEDLKAKEAKRHYTCRTTCALGGQAAAPGKADGWASANLGAGEVCVGVRDFWQQFPKGFSAGAEGLTVWLHHPAGKPFVARPGTAKTHEVFLDLRPSGRGGPGTAQALDTVFQEWPHARVAPSWTCASGVFGPLLPRGDALTGPYDMMTDYFLEYIRTRAKDIDFASWHLCGNGEFGDVSKPWPSMSPNLNHPWSPARAYFIEYLRGGDREWARLAARMARHAMDIDCPWPGPGAPAGQKVDFTLWVGYGKSSFPWSQAADRAKPPADIAAVLQREEETELPLARHQFKERKGAVFCGLGGLMPFYLCCGDRRALEIARKQGERLLDGQKAARGMWSKRLVSDVSNLLDVYEATGEARFLAGAAAAAARAVTGGEMGKSLKTNYYPLAAQSLLRLLELNRDETANAPVRKAFADWAAASIQRKAGGGCVSTRMSYLYSWTAAANWGLWPPGVEEVFRNQLAGDVIEGLQGSRLKTPIRLDAATVPFQRVEKVLRGEDRRYPLKRAKSHFYCFLFESGLESSMIVFPHFLAEFKRYRERHLR